MAKTRVLISVKTYPAISKKYDELVCTAGFLEDGSWIRIYPVPFRKLPYEQQYKKWQWIELDLIKNTEDFRKESFRPYDMDENIEIIGSIDTKNNWQLRKEIALKNVCYNLTDLIEKSKIKPHPLSLAVFKPKEIIDFVIEEVDREWNPKKLKSISHKRLNRSLFDIDSPYKVFETVKKLPYKFSYVFKSEGDTEHKLMIEDWEIGALYWNSLKKSNGDEIEACKKIKEQYWDNFVKNKDLYFFLGTKKDKHYLARNPFSIIGVFYPDKDKPHVPSLFDFDIK